MVSGPQISFSASYDKTTKIISAVVGVVLLLPVVATQSLIVGALAAALMLVAYAYSPRRYTISDRYIIVHRLVGNARFPLDGIREVRATTSTDFDGAVRLWGNGGLFGYYGLFRTAKLGKCWWYVTNRNNAVVVITGAKTAVFSPDDAGGFLRAIGAAAPVATVSPGSTPETTGASRSGGVAGKFLGAAIAVVALAVVAFALLYSPGPPDYTLTPTSLTIHDRFYPVTLDASAVDLRHMRVVDIGLDPDWRPTGRTNGFANSHYRCGWFRVSNGQKVRMYQADGKRVILLPAKNGGAPVLLEVAEPEKFVEQVRREWFGRP